MLLSEYLSLRNQITVTTGTATTMPQQQTQPVNDDGNTFAEELREKLRNGGGVDFSGHALKRIESRKIDVSDNDRLERLNKGVELAAEKGSNDALVLVDNTAFVVSVANNKVITTLSAEDLKGNVFTNIDSTVII